MRFDGVYCNLCGCWYSTALRSVGEQCGDRSYCSAAPPCPGRCYRARSRINYLARRYPVTAHLHEDTGQWIRSKGPWLCCPKCWEWVKVLSQGHMGLRCNRCAEREPAWRGRVAGGCFARCLAQKWRIKQGDEGMAFVSKPNQCGLFVNEKSPDKSDYTANLDVECPRCHTVSSWWVNGWKKVGRSGVKYISLALKPKFAATDKPAANGAEDKIPF